MQWKTATGQIKNKQHDGCLKGQSTCLIATKEEIIQKLPTNFDKSNDRHCCLEQTSDHGDRNSKDCFSCFTNLDKNRKPSSREGAQINTTLQIQHDDKIKNINIFDITSIGPTFANEKNSFGTNAFAVEATCGVASQKARPV
jgi:hypothetical protein